MKNYKIYKHTNKVNGKIYIGQTYTSLQNRFGKMVLDMKVVKYSILPYRNMDGIILSMKY